MPGRTNTPRQGRSARSDRRRGRSTSRAAASGGARQAGAQRGRRASYASDSNRVFIPLVLFAVVAMLFFGRLFYMQVIMSGQWSAEAEESRTSTLTVEAKRGTIYDRNGNILAVSVEKTTIYVDPTEVDDTSTTVDILVQVLGGNASDYTSLVEAEGTRYSVIQRKADTELGDAVQALVDEQTAEGVATGIHLVSEWQREYPYGQVGGQIVGACNIGVDEESNREYYYGMCGLELYYDDMLSGTPGYYSAEYSASGVAIPGAEHEVVDPVDGQDIVISIDIDLQASLENILTSGLESMEASGGSSVVMDGATGEIYAAASLPLFNPADRSTVEEGSTSLKAVTDLFEPGSIFKTVSAMAVLETDTLEPEDTLYCPAYLSVDGFSISDAHERYDITYTFRQIINYSSNVGISLAAKEMGFDKLYDYILKYNLHSDTGIDYPGEGEEGTDVLGYLTDYEDWTEAQAYNISFGQGISITPMQIVRFYGALTNDGVECTPHFLIDTSSSDEETTWETETVIENKEALEEMKSMLKSVVTDGTGTEAAIDGYNVAGKTSTAEIYDSENGGYKDGVYNIAFTGYIDDSDSQLVCFVGANEVGFSNVVTPIFKDIMTAAIDRYNIQSDE